MREHGLLAGRRSLVRVAVGVRVAAALATSLVLLGSWAGSALAQDDSARREFVSDWSAERVDELETLFASIGCPTLTGATFESSIGVTTRPTTGPLADGSQIDLLDVADQPSWTCNYVGLETQQPLTITITFDRDGESGNSNCEREPSPNQSTTDLGNVVPGRSISAQISASNAPASTLAELEDRARTMAAQVQPLARGCPAEPVVVICPEIPDFTAGEVRTESYSGAPDTYKASCSYQLADDQATPRINVEVQVTWVPSMATAAARLASVCATETVFDRGWGTIAGDGLAIRAVYGISSFEPVDPEPVEAAVRDVIGQVAGQAQSCDGVEFVPRSEQFTPVPAPYAAAFAPEHLVGRAPPLVAELGTGGPSPAEPIDAAPETDTAAPSIDEPVADAPTSTTVPVDEDGAEAAMFVRSDDAGPTGWWAIILRLGTIVLLVVSVIGLALAFLLIRRETRVRPRLDLARLVIVLASAAAMVLIFAKGAPVWAIAVAVVAGLSLGYLQGNHLALRLTERGIMAKRTAWAIAAFAASLVLSQIAGLLNRTGAIALGISLSFLSAALTAGLIAGRRPRIVEARHAAAMALMAMLIVAALGLDGFGAERVDAQDDGLSGTTDNLEIGAVLPEQRTTGHDALIDAVPWDAVEITGGLWWDEGKPFSSAPVPRALDGVPAPVTRTVEWVASAAFGRGGDRLSVTETFEFAARSDGWCCSVTYSAEGTRTPVAGEPEVWSVSGRLDDIQSVAIEGNSGFKPSNFGGQAFSEVIAFDAPGDAAEPTVCKRVVGVSRAARLLERGGGVADLSIRVDGVAQEYGVSSAMALAIPCELPGMSLQNALDAAPPPPAVDDEARRGCPVVQETVRALSTGTTFEGFSTDTLVDVVLTPNEPTCQYGALVAMPAIGQGGRGNKRIEFAVDVAVARRGEWDLGYSRWGSLDNQAFAFGPSDVPERERCSFEADGTLIEPEPGRTCQAFSLHRIELPGPAGFRQAAAGAGWLQIWTQYNLADGPNASLYAAFPWASYYVRCHHCSPNDPEIVAFLTRLHDFYRAGFGSFGGSPGEPPAAQPADESAPDATGPSVSTPSDASDAAAASETTADSELDALLAGAPTGPGDQTSETALVAILGALAAAGLLGTALAEVGLSIPELFGAWREGGRGGVDAAVAARVGTPAASADANLDVDPDGPGEDGMYDWGGRRVSAEDYGELLAQEAAIEAARQERIDALVAMMESDTAADERFEGLHARSADDDRRARDALADELETMRNQARTRERVADLLEERARAGGWDPIADRIANGEELTREELISIRTTLDRLSEEQGTVDHDATGSFETDLLDEFVKDAATAQEALARVAEHTPGGPIAAWAVRNPVAAGRVAAAFATGGLSEGVITPYEIAAAMERAAARAHAEGRDLTYGEAVAAGAWQVGPGMLIGKVAQVGIDRFGRTAAELAEEGLDAVNRRIGDFLESGVGAGAREGLEAGAREGFEAGIREGAETAASRVATAAATPPRLSPQDLSELKTQVADALKSGDDEALRAIYQNGGMNRLGQLEAAGGLDQQTASALVDFHDRLTGNAVRQGTHDTIAEFARLNGGIKPREVLVANSGSVGAGRSVVTDADRTISTSFSTDDIDRWIVSRGGGMTRTEAAREMRTAFTNLHEVNVARNLNPPGTANPVTANDMDISSYSGFGGGTAHSDLYPTGYTQARMATQGSTEVYSVSGHTGEASVHTTSGQAIIDHNMLEDVRFSGKEIPMADGWPVDPTRISNSELGNLLAEQQKAVAKYSDVKSVAKALDRAEYIAARSRQPMGNQALVDAAVRIRTDPRQTAAVLNELGMSESQFVAASREMMSNYAPTLPTN